MCSSVPKTYLYIHSCMIKIMYMVEGVEVMTTNVLKSKAMFADLITT